MDGMFLEKDRHHLGSMHVRVFYSCVCDAFYDGPPFRRHRLYRRPLLWDGDACVGWMLLVVGPTSWHCLSAKRESSATTSPLCRTKMKNDKVDLTMGFGDIIAILVLIPT